MSERRPGAALSRSKHEFRGSQRVGEDLGSDTPDVLDVLASSPTSWLPPTP